MSLFFVKGVGTGSGMSSSSSSPSVGTDKSSGASLRTVPEKTVVYPRWSTIFERPKSHSRATLLSSMRTLCWRYVRTPIIDKRTADQQVSYRHEQCQVNEDIQGLWQLQSPTSRTTALIVVSDESDMLYELLQAGFHSGKPLENLPHGQTRRGAI
jgi:hypothetical protein